MKRLIIMLVGLSFFSGLSGQKPDFAYPEKVSANASASFEKAMKEGDELTGLRNLMDFYIARLQKGTEEQNAAYTFLSEKNDDFKNPVFRSLLIAFRARILTETYRRNRWKMDQRETPLQPFPASISEWSGEQMRFAIDSLCNDALSASSVLREVPVTQYPSIVTVEKQAIPFYPSLLDFVVSLSADRPDRPDSRMTPAQVEELVSLNPLPDKGFPVIDGYSLLLEDRSEVSPAVVQCALSRLNLGCRLAGLSSSESRALKEKLYSMLCTASGDPTDESAGLVLSDILSNVGRNDEALGLYSRAKKYLAKWPEGLFSPNIKAFIAEIEGPSALVRFPSVAYPGHTFDLDVNAYNLKKCKVEFFKANIPFGALLTLEQRPKIVSGKPYKTVVIDLPDAEVGREVQIKKEVELPEVGAYLVTLNFDGMSDRKRPDIEQINVSAFTLFAFGVRNYSVLVADGESGKGIGDVDLFSKKNNSSLLPLGKTSADGMYEANSDRISGRNIFASKGLDRYASPIYVYERYRETKKQCIINGFTSLPLYHLGDSVEFTAVVYEAFPGGLSLPLKDETLEVFLYSPVREKVDSVKLTTDAFGRIIGKFMLPENLLTGRYFITTEKGYEMIASFMVSDYKLPSFEVLINEPEWKSDSLKMSGTVFTYTGLPVSDATVHLHLSTRFWWWRSRGGNFDLKIEREVTTDSEGHYSFEIPLSLLPPFDSPVVYVAEISATDRAGESQKAARSFIRKDFYKISAKIPEVICLDCENIDIPVEVTDPLGKVVKIPLRVTLKQGESAVLESVQTDGRLTSDVLASCPSGNYQIEISAVESITDVESLKKSVVVYRTTDKDTPCPDEFAWVPVSNLALKYADTETSFYYGVNHACTLRAFLTSGDTILWKSEQSLAPGMHRLTVPYKPEWTHANLHLLYIGGMNSEQVNISVRREEPRNELRFVVESFRDNLTPGITETWTFKIVDGSDNGRMAAVIAGMYNSAIESLASSSWTFSPAHNYFDGWDLCMLRNFPQSILAFMRPPVFGPTFNISRPEYHTYDYNLAGYEMAVYHVNKMAVRCRSAMADADMYVDEEEEVDMAPAGSSADAGVVTMSNAPMFAQRKMDYNFGAADHEEDEAAKEPKFEYREVETPLAFFRPQLQADSDGRVQLVFTVPQANARWAFKAIAYTDSMFATSFVRNIVSTKPLMVKVNLPRFARSGDKIEIVTDVRNATDSAISTVSVAEFFSPFDGKIIKSQYFTNTIDAKKSALLISSVDIPANLSAIGFRVRSAADDFSDGEQTLIPVLPSQSMVYNSVPFYISPDSAEFSLRLPSIPDSAQVSLQYCNNPSWYLITTLPGLSESKPFTAIEAADIIVASSMARQILAANPEIAKALSDWSSNPDSEMLTSMLERNEQLKQLMLASTPWTVTAENDSQRMSRLALLLSDRNIKKSLEEAIAVLKRLQNGDGGWKWIEGYSNSSSWVTSRIVTRMALLNMMGALPADGSLRNMLGKALRYEDDCVKREFSRHPESVFPNYVLTHQLLSDIFGAPAAVTAVNHTVQDCLRNWKNYSLGEKATVAMIFEKSGYPRIARQVMESIGEFASTSPERGMSFPVLHDTWWNGFNQVATTGWILMAYEDILPESDKISKLCQWLISEKTTTDWSDYLGSSYITAAILGAGKNTLAPKLMPDISIGNERVEVSPTPYTGEINTALSASLASENSLTIVSHDSVPSWGSVAWRYEDSISDIEAAGSEDLSIEKKYYVKDASGNFVETDRFSVGDRVRVSLVVRVGSDMDYVTVVDDRPACFEPVEQLPSPVFAQGLCFYRENRDTSTRLFIDHLPRGYYLLQYEMWVNNAGTYASGIATVQSQYAPRFVAHSGGSEVFSSPSTRL